MNFNDSDVNGYKTKEDAISQIDCAMGSIVNGELILNHDIILIKGEIKRIKTTFDIEVNP